MNFNAFLPLKGLTTIASVCFICKSETHSDSQSPRPTRRQAARAQLAAKLPSTTEILRGSLLHRRIRHRSGCAVCARGPGHWVWVLTVSYPGGRTKQLSLSAQQKPMVQQCLRNYRKLKATLER